MPNFTFMNHHQLDLMKAALPYLAPRMQKSINVMSIAEELVSTIQSPQPTPELSAMSLSSGNASMEDILSQIKPVCNRQEQELIDNMVNVMKMQKLFQGYSSFMATRQAANLANTVSAAEGKTDGAQNNTHSQNFGNQSHSGFGGSQDTLMEFLMSQLAPEQKSNFENISMVLNSLNN